MSENRSLPDARTIQLLRDQGWTLAAIGKQYGVTESGVWRALERANLLGPSSSYKDILPWTIEREHQSTAVMRNFRTLLYQREGREIRPAALKALNVWLERLKESNLVVNYHPDAPPNDASSKGGFYYVPRESTDEWIIRMPEMEVSDLTANVTSEEQNDDRL